MQPEDLIDISEVKVSHDLSRSERYAEYARQLGDVEHYKASTFKVTAVFPKNAPPLEEFLQNIAK